MIVDTSASPNARFTMAAPESVKLDGGGLLGALYARGIDTTVPTMGDLLFDPEVAHAYDNFLIAAGEAEGEFGGFGFMDGDFFKWLESAVTTPSDAQREDLLERIELAVRAIGAAQEESGYLQTKTTIARRNGQDAAPFDERMDFETYNFGHLMTLACIHHRATGSDALLTVARNTAEFLIRVAEQEPEKIADCNICPSHYMGVVELYRTTGDPRYLELANTLLNLHGGKGYDGSDDNQDVLPVREQTKAVGHAVRANYLYAGMADYALEVDDEGVRSAVEAIWDDLVSSKLYITGGCGALYDGASPDAGQDWLAITRVHQAYGRPYELPHTTAYNESCASLGLLMWAWRMLALTGDGKYADEIERVLFNALPAMIGVEGDSYFYTNPLRQVRDLTFPLRRAGDGFTQGEVRSHDRPRQQFMQVFCCPPNIARTITEMPYYVYGQRNNELWVHQFVQSDWQASVEGQSVRVSQVTDFPNSGDVSVSVRSDRPVDLVLRIRVPGWSQSAEVRVNGELVDVVENGYAVLSRTWSDDIITVSLDLGPYLVVAHHFVEEATNQVCVMRGPVVYCLEEADVPDGVPLDELSVPAAPRWTTSQGDGLFQGVTTLEVDLVRAERQVPHGELYTRFRAGEAVPVRATLVPYALWGNRGPGEMTVWVPLAREMAS